MCGYKGRCYQESWGWEKTGSAFLPSQAQEGVGMMGSLLHESKEWWAVREPPYSPRMLLYFVRILLCSL